MKEIPLGQATTYADTYAPELLAPVQRAPIREALDIQTTPMFGIDIWNVFEASWLDNNGKPQVACLEMTYPANSPAIVESKSLKLYFNSMNQTKFADLASYIATIKQDLQQVIGAPVDVLFIDEILPADDWLAGYECIDGESVQIDTYRPAPELLKAATDKSEITHHKWVSHLFKTNCMVTGQPDWGSVFIDYEGPQLDAGVILKYLISFRDHQAFHEPSCEMIYDHLMRYCQPLALSVYCRYTRRGGIDINPFRANKDLQAPPNLRLLRQ